MSFSKALVCIEGRSRRPDQCSNGSLEARPKLLLEWDASEGILREAIRCPECQSLQVHYPQFAHRSLIPNLMRDFWPNRLDRRRNTIARTVITRGQKTEPKRSILYLERKPYRFVDGIEQTLLRPKPAQSESRANGLQRYPELGLSLTEIRTAGVVIASG